jgi:formylglycine-generating enzyme
MKRSRKDICLAALILITVSSASRCVLGDDAAKHRCVTDDDCMGERSCVDGHCRDDVPGRGGMAGMEEGGTGGVSGASGDAGRATGGAGRGGGSGNAGGSGAGSDSKAGGPSLGGAGGGVAGEGGEGGEGANQACPPMVRLPEGFCIDSTEVTRNEYLTWLAMDPPVPATGLCSSNTSYEPDCVWPATANDRPASCVDWCDADAYCRTAGKRLCGRIDGGGAVDYSTGYDDAGESEWFAACSSGGMHDFPYGDTWGAGHCVDLAASSEAPASRASCQSPAPDYDCVFDLSGNASEWENSCSDDTETAACRLRGGFYGDDMVSQLACAADASLQRTGTVVARGIGFRCCKDECP